MQIAAGLAVCGLSQVLPDHFGHIHGGAALASHILTRPWMLAALLGTWMVGFGMRYGTSFTFEVVLKHNIEYDVVAGGNSVKSTAASAQAFAQGCLDRS